MATVGSILARLLASVVGLVVMITVAILAFFVTVLVVTTGATLGGHSPDGNYVVLSSSLLVLAAVIAGALWPTTRIVAEEIAPIDADDPTYD